MFRPIRTHQYGSNHQGWFFADGGNLTGIDIYIYIYIYIYYVVGSISQLVGSLSLLIKICTDNLADKI